MGRVLTADLGGQVSDAQLAARLRRDPALFTVVFDRHFRAIYLYVVGRLDVQAAEDLAAETFLVALVSVAGSTPNAAACGPGCSVSPRIWWPGTGAKRLATTGRWHARGPCLLRTATRTGSSARWPPSACGRSWRRPSPGCPRASATSCCSSP